MPASVTKTQTYSKDVVAAVISELRLFDLQSFTGSSAAAPSAGSRFHS